MGFAGDLLSRGLFPRELPPLFSSTSFSGFAEANRRKLVRQDASELASHSLARIGTLRRSLGIPNPITQLSLASTIDQNWDAIHKHCEQSALSLTCPTKTLSNSSPRACEPLGKLGIRPQRRISARSTKRRMIRADVSSFYHSIYTHSIPWALHGKTQAKKNRSNSLYGNTIDKHVRNTQYGQTVGIPIGPDTSLVIAEAILTSVDLSLSERFSKISGFRYIDDYEINCSSEQEAQDVLGNLEECLAHYELRLNPLKTHITDLPQVFAEPWISSLREFEFDETSANRELQSLMRFFDLATTLRTAHPQDHVFQYALGRLCNVSVFHENFEAYQHILVSASTSEPGCLPRILARLQELKLQNYKISLELVEAHLNDTVKYHSAKGHSSEVAWSLYGALLFSVPIHNSARCQIEKSNDDTVALLALQVDFKNLMRGELDTSNWERLLIKEELYGQHWLLAYEAIASRLLVPGGEDYLDEDPFFKHVHDAGVSFLMELNTEEEFQISTPGVLESDDTNESSY